MGFELIKEKALLRGITKDEARYGQLREEDGWIWRWLLPPSWLRWASLQGSCKGDSGTPGVQLEKRQDTC